MPARPAIAAPAPPPPAGWTAAPAPAGILRLAEALGRLAAMRHLAAIQEPKP